MDEGAPDLLPGIISSVDRQRNRVSDHGLPPGFDDALFQAISKIGVTWSSRLKYVDSLCPSLKPLVDERTPSRQSSDEFDGWLGKGSDG